MENTEYAEEVIADLMERKTSSHIRRTSIASFIQKQDETFTMLLENGCPINKDVMCGVAIAFDLISERFGIPEFGDKTDWRHWSRYILNRERGGEN